jgi:hypothetical protein
MIRLFLSGRRLYLYVERDKRIVAQACRFENPSALINSTTSSGFTSGLEPFFHYILQGIVGQA